MSNLKRSQIYSQNTKKHLNIISLNERFNLPSKISFSNATKEDVVNFSFTDMENYTNDENQFIFAKKEYYFFLGVNRREYYDYNFYFSFDLNKLAELIVLTRRYQHENNVLISAMVKNSFIESDLVDSLALEGLSEKYNKPVEIIALRILLQEGAHLIVDKETEAELLSFNLNPLDFMWVENHIQENYSL